MNKWILIVYAFYNIVCFIKCDYNASTRILPVTFFNLDSSTTTTPNITLPTNGIITTNRNSLTNKRKIRKSFPAISANDFLHDQDYCFKSCLQSTLDVYHSCMKNCDKSWPFIDGGSCDDLRAENNSFIEVPCAPGVPPSATYLLIHKIELHLYLKLTWLPCQTSLYLLKGFEIGVEGRHYRSCHVLKLSPNITLTNIDKNKAFSFILPTNVEYSKKYVVRLQSLPFFKKSLIGWPIKSPSCTEKNGNYSCQCDNARIIPPLNYTIRGYTVSVTAEIPNPCFKVDKYEFIIASKVEFSNFDYYSIDSENFILESGRSIAHATFTNVYTLMNPNAHLAIRIFFHPLEKSTKPIPIEIIVWRPPVPNVKILSPSSVEASFSLSDKYDIKVYQFRLSRLHLIDDKVVDNKTLSVKEVPVVQGKKNVSCLFLGLTEGYYSIQVREVRVPKKDDWGDQIFKNAVWGPTQKFHLVPTQDTNWRLQLIIYSILATFLIVLVITFLFLWKRGYCQPFRKSLPRQVVYWLDNQTIPIWSKKTVLIVWQADFRSSHLMNKQSEIISRFSAFLRSVGGLDVILDLYEEEDLNRGIGKWVQKSCEKADNIIFVCPHFNYVAEKAQTSSFTGNFQRLYRYMEGDLGNRAKFITVVFPYSAIDATSDICYLMKMTSVFKLMEQLEPLYFHIQGTPQFDCLGRHSAVSVNEDDYESAPGGKALSDALKEFQEMLLNYSRNSSLSDLTATDNDHEDDPLMNDDSSGSGSDCQKDYSDKDQESSVLVHSLAPIESPSFNRVMTKERSPLEPIVPFVENPEEELRKINERSKLHFEERNHCPYHNDLPNGSIAGFREPPSTDNFRPDSDFSHDDTSCSVYCVSESVEVVDEIRSGGTDAIRDSGFESTRV